MDRDERRADLVTIDAPDDKGDADSFKVDADRDERRADLVTIDAPDDKGDADSFKVGCRSRSAS
jgi:hypothetical protein